MGIFYNGIDVTGESYFRSLTNGAGDIITIDTNNIARRRTPSQLLTDIGAQPLITNLVTGAGSNGQVTFWNSTSGITGDNNFIWDNTNKNLNITGNTTTSILNIVGTSQTSFRENLLKFSLSDSGNDAFYISNGTVNDGVFWPVFAGYGSSTTRSGLSFLGLIPSSADIAGSDRGIINLETNITNNATNPLNGSFSPITNRSILTIQNNNTNIITVRPNGNILIGTTSDSGFRLDLNGSARISGSTTITGSLTVDTNTFFVDSVNNRIGIGTTTPSVLQDIVGGADGVETIFTQIRSQFVSTNTATAIRLGNSSSGLVAQGSVELVALRTNDVTSGATDFIIRTSVGASITEKWRITSTGVLQSNGEQTIQTSTGNLRISTNGGNGNIILTPNGTGNILINGTTSISNNKVRIFLTSSSDQTVAIEGFNNRGFSVGSSQFGGLYGAQIGNDTVSASNYGTVIHMNARYDGTNYISQNSFIRPQHISLRNGEFYFSNGPVTTSASNISMTDVFTIKYNGNILIGTTLDSGYKLDVSGTTRITNTLEVDTVNNGAGDFLTRDANGVITRRTATEVRTDIGAFPSASLSISTGQVAFGTGTNTIGGSSNLFWDNTNGRLGINRTPTTNALEVSGIVRIKESTIGGQIRLESSGTTDQWQLYYFSSDNTFRINYNGVGDDELIITNIGETTLRSQFSPTSGTVSSNTLRVSGVINQTGGANGITRGLLVDPTLTSAADWRSIEWSNNTGWGLYGTGTANNYLNGALGIGATALNGVNIGITRNISGALSGFGVTLQSIILSDVTNGAIGYNSSLGTVAASFTLSGLSHFVASQSTFGAGSVVTEQNGFHVFPNLIGANLNIGFRGRIPSASGRWNLYMDGTASNYLRGNLLLNTTTDAGFLLDVAGTTRITGTTTIDNTLSIRASSTASAATQIPVFTADPSSTTRTLVTRTPAQLLSDAGGLSGTIATGQVAFGTATNTLGGSNDLFYNTSSKGFSINYGNSPQFTLHVHNPVTGSTATSYTHYSNGNTGTSITRGVSIGLGGDGNTYINNRENSILFFSTNNTARWSILSTGELRSQGAGTITTLSNGNLLLSPNGTGNLQISSNTLIGTTTDNGSRLQVNGSVTITNAILSNQENLDVDSGATRVIATISSSSYTAVFFDYSIKNGTNLRCGTIYVTHDGTNIVFTETSTADLGDTTPVELSVDLNSGNIRLLATTTTNNWVIKTLIRGI